MPIPLLGYDLSSHAAELSAGAVTALYVWLFGKKSGIRLRSAVSGAVYFICAGAVNAGNGDWVLFAAVFFRAVMCAAAAYCMIRAGELVKNGGISAEKMSYVPGGAFCAGIVYMIAVAALCSKDMGILNPGRIAAGFCTAAAARKAKAAIRKAFEYSMKDIGLSFVEIVATCNSGWKMSPVDANKWMVENMFAKYPLGDIKDVLK